MSIAHNEFAAKLAFGMPDRLAKALAVSNVTSIEMGEYLGVSRTTISNYTSGRSPLKKQTLRLWALRTGVPLEWLEDGTMPTDTTPDDGGTVTALYQSGHARKSQNSGANVHQLFRTVEPTTRSIEAA